MSRGGKEDHALGGGQVKELGGSLLQAAEETQAERRFTYVVTCPPEGDPPIPLHPVTQSLLNSFKAIQHAHPPFSLHHLYLKHAIFTPYYLRAC